MDLLGGALNYLIPFLVVLTILVFVHEWGHYAVARRNGVRVEVFSIGFGPELFGFNDKAGTRWKFSLIPLGGYVKMFGDADMVSRPDGSTRTMTPGERDVSFHHKSLGQRSAIVLAGPLANFGFAIVALTVLFMSAGHPFPPPVVGSVQPGSAAEMAGIEAGDRFIRVDDQRVHRFADLSSIVRRAEGRSLEVLLQRPGEGRVSLAVLPRLETVTLSDGTEVELPRLGVAAATEPVGPLRAATSAVTETVALSWLTLSAIGEMIIGERGTEDLGGPIRIAQISGDVAQFGIIALIWLMAILSINLGLINLMPVPMLDGGHLMFYALEAVRGRPLGERAQEYGFRIGLALVLTLMVFATWNDLVQLEVVSYLRDLLF